MTESTREPLDLDAIQARSVDAARNRRMYRRPSRSLSKTNEESAADVPSLLAEVRRLTEERDRLAKAINGAPHSELLCEIGKCRCWKAVA